MAILAAEQLTITCSLISLFIAGAGQYKAVGELPSHKPNITISTKSLLGNFSATGGNSNAKPLTGSGVFTGNGTLNAYGQNGPYLASSANYARLDFDGTHSHDLVVDSIGADQAHNNMMPYLSVFMWRRVA
ncbi:hypothetical protein [uncultured Phascolarctobacterium sp.]|uniref:hypothetical protein n=1 Tax=uncultured Phascolarctobacterium sp. TaxID=512296 RepID=UPI0025FA3E19|nr:hypothetical protein [uncultured Phascolarctobacterium sp.]